MNEIDNTFIAEVIKPENILLAFDRIKRNSYSNNCFNEFEIAGIEVNVLDMIKTVQANLENKEYKLQKFKIVNRVKKISIDGDQKTIDFRPLTRFEILDEIYIQAVFNIVVKNLGHLLDDNNYSTRVDYGKSTNIYGSWYNNYSEFRNRALSNFEYSSKYQYAYSFDLKNFYPSINQKIVCENIIYDLEQESKLNLDKQSKIIIRNIIEFYHEDNCHNSDIFGMYLADYTLNDKGYGIPQGPLFSQFLAVYYLKNFIKNLIEEMDKVLENAGENAELDCFMYMDDGYIFSSFDFEEIESGMVKKCLNIALEGISRTNLSQSDGNNKAKNEVQINEEKFERMELDDVFTHSIVNLKQDVSMIRNSINIADDELSEYFESVNKALSGIENKVSGFEIEQDAILVNYFEEEFKKSAKPLISKLSKSVIKHEDFEKYIDKYVKIDTASGKISLDKVNYELIINRLQESKENDLDSLRFLQDTLLSNIKEIHNLIKNSESTRKYSEFGYKLLDYYIEHYFYMLSKIQYNNFDYELRYDFVYSSTKNILSEITDKKQLMHHTKETVLKMLFCSINDNYKFTKISELFGCDEKTNDDKKPKFLNDDLSQLNLTFLSTNGVSSKNYRGFVQQVLSKNKVKFSLSDKSDEELTSSCFMPYNNGNNINSIVLEYLIPFSMNRDNSGPIDIEINTPNSYTPLSSLKEIKSEDARRLSEALFKYWEAQQRVDDISLSVFRIKNIYVKKTTNLTHDFNSVLIIKDEYDNFFGLGRITRNSEFQEVVNELFGHIFHYNVELPKRLNFKNLKVWQFRILALTESPNFRLTKFVEIGNSVFDTVNFDLEDVDVDRELFESYRLFRNNIKGANSQDFIDNLIKIHHYYQSVWKNGSKDLFFYTLHNQSHSITLIRNFSKVQKKLNGLMRLGNYELYIFFAACYLHDIGMLVSPSEKEIRDFYFNQCSKDLISNGKIYKNGYNLQRDLEIYDFVENMFEKLVRDRHAYKVLDAINKNKYLPVTDLEKEIISKLSENHAKDPRMVYGEDPIYDTAKGKVRIKIVSAWLRFMDLSDVGKERVTSEVLDIYANRIGEESLYHWVKHLATDSIKVETSIDTSENLKAKYERNRLKIDVMIYFNYVPNKQFLTTRNSKYCFCNSQVPENGFIKKDCKSLLCNYLSHTFIISEIESFNKYLSEEENVSLAFKWDFSVQKRENFNITEGPFKKIDADTIVRNYFSE